MTADERFIYQAPDTDEEFGVRSEIITGPVSDWATDFSHLEPEWSADPYPIQDDLRQRCPIAHTDRFGGGGPATRSGGVAADRAPRPFGGRGAAGPVGGRGGDRLRHRAVLLAVDHHGQLPAARR